MDLDLLHNLKLEIWAQTLMLKVLLWNSERLFYWYSGFRDDKDALLSVFAICTNS